MATYVISDVHGAGEELQGLINKINPSPTDEIILVGDVFDRGFHGHLVWELIHKYNMPVLLGNHENKMKKFFHRERDGVPLHYLWAFTNLFETTKVVSQEDFIEWLDYLPLLLERKGVLIAHAGVNVLSPKEASVECNIYGNVSPHNRQRQDWWKAYNGDQLVVWGHMIPKGGEPLFWRNAHGKINSVCIDTGAVHGGNLTAYCIETREIIQFRSGIDHFSRMESETRRNLPNFRL